ncbi:MAG: hypothetical protein GY717_01220 [Rhodobacteraceae bacterium]|nr:hypothetical protein [Paracoccaceae bacterium]
MNQVSSALFLATCRPRRVIVGVMLALLCGCTSPKDPASSPPFPNLNQTPSPSMTDEEIAAAGRVPAGSPAPSTRPRLFGFLQKRVPGEVTATGAAPPRVAASGPPPTPSMTDEEIAAAGRLPEGTPQPSRRPRLFGFLKKRIPGNVAVPPAQDSNAGVFRVALSPDAGPVAAAPGLLPFGQVLRACGVKRSDMGKVVARTNSAGGFKLHDPNPSSAEPRSQFLTGFRDGCARQFTASLALFGSPSVHEATRYNPLNTNPYTATDTAYEKIKNRICGVRKGEFCPDKRATRLEKAAAFVSIYRGFGDTGEWMEIFLHKGQLVTYETRVR